MTREAFQTGRIGSPVATVGRVVELAAGSGALATVARSGGGILVVEGEPGIGKSHLLRVWADDARASGLDVLLGAGAELEQEHPFGVVLKALAATGNGVDPRLAELHHVLRETRVPEADRRYAIVETIADLLEKRATSSPLALIVDDLQWCDDASLATLARVASQTRLLPIALFLASRPMPRRARLAAFLRALDTNHAERLVLRPLGAEATTEFVTRFVGAKPGTRLSQTALRCGGNPLFLRHLLETLEREEMLVATGDDVDVVAEAGSRPLPKLSTLILRHLSVLPPHTLDLLRVASVVGSTFSLSALRDVTRRQVTDLLVTLRPALDAGLLIDTGSSLAFQHDLVRDAVYDDLGPSMRRALHTQVADVLARAGFPASLVATHYASGAEIGDERAVQWLMRAARENAADDPAGAVAMLERAVSILAPASPHTASAHLLFGQALTAAGRLDEAKTVLTRLIQTAPEERIDIGAREVLMTVLRGQGESINTQVAVLLSNPSLTPAERARFLAFEVNSRVWTGDIDDTPEDAAKALELGHRHNDWLAQHWALTARDALARYNGYFAVARDIAREDAGVVTAGVKNGAAPSDDSLPLVGALVLADSFDEARAVLGEGTLWARRGLVQPARHWHLMLSLAYRGEWDDAIAEGETAMRLGDEMGEVHVSGAIGLVLGLIVARRDELARAESLLERSRPVVSEDLHLHAVVAAYVQAARGDRAAALALLRAVQSSTSDRRPRWGPHIATWRNWGGTAVQLLLQLGDVPSAAAVAADVEAVAARAQVESITGLAQLCRGMVDHDADLLCTAAAVLRGTPRVVDLALACEEAAVATRSSALFDEALSLYERLQARRDIARTRARMRELGLRKGRIGAHPATRTGLASLTPTERRVAALIDEGLMYKEIAERLFVSRRTVETHVLHMFAKLGVGTRVELARLLRRERVEPMRTTRVFR